MTSSEQPQVKILFVDDEQETLLALGRLLKNENFELITATSGEDGLEILNNTKGIGVIVSDQAMPAMSGIEFLKRAWELSPNALRIMLTGRQGQDLEHEALYKGGAFRFISKPWRTEELVKALRDAVATYLLIRENRRLTTRLAPSPREKAERNRQKTLPARS